jgi:hypothetical protein
MTLFFFSRNGLNVPHLRVKRGRLPVLGVKMGRLPVLGVKKGSSPAFGGIRIQELKIMIS